MQTYDEDCPFSLLFHYLLGVAARPRLGRPTGRHPTVPLRLLLRGVLCAVGDGFAVFGTEEGWGEIVGRGGGRPVRGDRGVAAACRLLLHQTPLHNSPLCSGLFLSPVSSCRSAQLLANAVTRFTERTLMGNFASHQQVAQGGKLDCQAETHSAKIL